MARSAAPASVLGRGSGGEASLGRAPRGSELRRAPCVRRALLLGALAFTLACGGDPAGNPVPSFEFDYLAGRPRGPRPHFSFFVTSQAGLFSLGAGRYHPAPDPVRGFGGNLGGLRGADEICTALAQRANPGDTKIWRAFLSSSGLFGQRVDAVDRIGRGPWYSFAGYELAADVDGLFPVEEIEGRPRGAAPELAAMFSDENGRDARDRQNIDNHDTLTGSDKRGRLFDDTEGGRIATCEDWTSSTVRGRPGNSFAQGGQVPVGHSWPRNNSEGRHWISEHTVNGCEPGVDIDGGTAAPADDFRVGAAGGYGGFYCFALNAVPPKP